MSSGKQDYQTYPSLYPVNQPIAKLDGIIQSAGEAQYANDIPPMKREVFGAFVLSTVCSGQVCEIDDADILVSATLTIVCLGKENTSLENTNIPFLTSFW